MLHFLLNAQKSITDAVLDISSGVLSATLDLAISMAIFGSHLATSGKSPRGVLQAAESASLFPGISKEIIKRALWRATHSGLLQRKLERNRVFWEATEQGKKRLTTHIPMYFSSRPWSQRLFLICYDIPETLHDQRTHLRQFLEKLGAGRFQQSIYLLLWDPTEILKKFIQERGLSGMVIVSNTGTDGSIGEKNLDDLIWECFRLEELNGRYQALINLSKTGRINRVQLAFQYLSILADDPQLPFELLGPQWQGDRAYENLKHVLGEEAISLFSSIRPERIKEITT